LFVSNISVGMPSPGATAPTGLLAPVLDGEDTSYFEWLCAGSLEVREVAGAMHQSERRPPMLTLVRFGCDRERLYVRLDAGRPALDLLAEGFEFSLKFLNPGGLRFSVRQKLGRLAGTFWDRRAEAPHWVERGPGRSAVAAGSVLELAVAFSDLGGHFVSP